MRNCESWEIDLSSLVDRELPPADAAEALEHALACPSCAEFFRAARQMQATAESLRAEDGALDGERAAALWRAIAARTAGEARAESARRPRLPRALRAAALLALGLGGGWLLAALAGAGPGAGTPGGAPSAALGAPAAMDERRFVALADELLESDLRYQRAMLEVLRLVPALESGEGLRRGDESRIVLAANEEPRGGSL